MTDDKLEELFKAIDELNPHGSDSDRAFVVYDILKAAVCHNTSRAARYFRDGTPEGKLHRLLTRALYIYGKSDG